MSKITVLTSATSNYPLPDDMPRGNAQFLAYAELGTKSEFWSVKPICNLFTEPRRNAKIHKVLCHLYTDTEWIIWIDSNVTLNITPEELITEWANNKDMVVNKHMSRNCLYEEADECSRSSLDYKSIIKEQVKRYEALNIPKKMGLGECGIILRRNCPEINRLNEKWWAEICRGSSRDQISFPYVFRDVYTTVPIDCRCHKYFNYKQSTAPGRIYDNNICDT